MKRFTVVASIFSISVLAVWSFLQASPAYSSKAKFDNTPVRVYDATGEMLKAIHAGDQMAKSETRILPVYDATGAMLEAINPDKRVVTIPAYDATRAMLDAISP